MSGRMTRVNSVTGPAPSEQRPVRRGTVERVVPATAVEGQALDDRVEDLDFGDFR